MKKRAGKLSLSRETVRNLLGPQLGQAAGGTFVTDRCGVSYYCTGFPTSAGRQNPCDHACVDPNPPLVTDETL